MKSKIKIDRILVVSFNNNTQMLFCAMDENRIIFFDKLKIGGLCSLATEETIISVFREGKEIDKGTPYVTGGHVATIQLGGLDVMRREFNVSEGDWTNAKHLSSYDFKDGDVIEIKKDWAYHEEPEKSLSLIATFRSFGAHFPAVFGRRHENLVKKIINFSGQLFKQLEVKKIVFETCPDDEILGKFY